MTAACVIVSVNVSRRKNRETVDVLYILLDCVCMKFMRDGL